MSKLYLLIFNPTHKSFFSKPYFLYPSAEMNRTGYKYKYICNLTPETCVRVL